MPFQGELCQGAVVGIIPMKPTSTAKSRLASVLDPEQRSALCLKMLSKVLKAATGSGLLRVVVVGGDSPVQAEAKKWRADCVPDQGRGLNGELTWLLKENSSQGAASVYIPGDLPLLTSEEVNLLIETSKSGTLLTICPASGDGGTNGLVIPAGSPMRPGLGRDSFEGHKNAAAHLGLPYAVLDAPGFALDVDTADDLKELGRLDPTFFDYPLPVGDESNS